MTSSPSLDKVDRKFGETAAATQLIEAELGTMFLVIRGVAEE
jgi:hypothetical protein